MAVDWLYEITVLMFFLVQFFLSLYFRLFHPTVFDLIKKLKLYDGCISDFWFFFFFHCVKNTHCFSTQKEGSLNPFMEVIYCLSPVTCKRANPFTAYQRSSAGEVQNHLMRLSFGGGMLDRTEPLLAAQFWEEFFPLRSFQEVNLSQEMLRVERKDGE